MAKQKLLLVDADPRSLRVLDVSLRKAGYSVTASGDAMRALEMMDLSPPDLILSDTRLPGMDGFAFRQQVAMRDDWASIPFMFLSSEVSVESKVRGLELGVEDYLTKPIYIKEIITRVNLVLSRKQREGIEARASMSKTQFAGSLADMGLVDLLQTIDISRKSGVLLLQSGTQRGALYFTDGRLIDAEVGPLTGEAAVYRALVWSDGSFTLEFRNVRREETITSPTQGILMEGMRRLDEWGRLLEQLPPLDSVFEVDESQLLEKLSEIPDEINKVLRLFDGNRSLLEVVDKAGGDDLATLTAVSKLYFEGLVFPTGRRTSEYPRRDEPAAEEQQSSGPETELESDVVPGHEPTGLTNRPPAAPGATAPPTSVAIVASAPPPDKVLPSAAQGAGERAESNAAATPAGDTVPERAEAAGRDTLVNTQLSSTVIVGTGGAKPDEVGAPEAPAQLEKDAPPDDSGEDDGGAEGEDAMSKKGKRKKKAGRIEIPAVQALESADNVIQFPGKSARIVGGGAVAVGDGALSVPSTPVADHDEDADVGDRAGKASPSEREASAKVVVESEATDTKKAEAAAADAKKAEAAAADTAAEALAAAAAAKRAEAAADARAAAKQVEAAADAKKAEAAAAAEARTADEKKADEKKSAEARAKNVADRDEKADSSEDWKARSKKRTQSSGTLAAQGGAITITGEHPAMAEEFFNAPTYEATRAAPAEHETWDDLKDPAEPPDPAAQRARNWALVILGASAVGVASFFLYTQFFTVQGEPIGGAPLPAVLPTPEGPTPPQAAGHSGTGAQFITGEQVAAGTGEEPAPGTGEEPVPGTGEQVAAGTGEQPAAGSGEQPAAGTGEQPAAGTGEQVAAGTGEQPAAGTGEQPAAGTGEQPAAGTGEQPAAGTGEQPAAAPAGDYATILAQALAAARRNRTRDAVPLFEQAIAANPNGSEALSGLAMIDLNRNKMREAADLAGRAVAADPTNSEGWIVLGAARDALRDRAGAREAYRQCVERGRGRYVSDCRSMR